MVLTISLPDPPQDFKLETEGRFEKTTFWFAPSDPRRSSFFVLPIGNKNTRRKPPKSEEIFNALSSALLIFILKKHLQPLEKTVNPYAVYLQTYYR